MKKLSILLSILLWSSGAFCQVSDGQPIPETGFEKALNQYSHLCINTSDQTIDYKPESHLKLGGFGQNYIEYILTEDLSHFGVNLIPLGLANDANLKVELTLEGQVYGYEFNGFQTLKDLDGNVIANSIVSGEKETITLGVDGGVLVLEVNGTLISSQSISESTEGAKVRLTSISAVDECFWFYLDASYRRSLNRVNFVESELFVQEGGSVQVCIDLTLTNRITDAVFRISLLPSASPHFYDFQPVDLTISAGNSGPICFNLSTDNANLIKDSNKEYTFNIEVLSGSHIGLGAKSKLKVKVIDDFLPFGNNLVPGDLMFVGFESDIGSGDDQIILTNLVDLNKGTSFQITNATYNAGVNQFQNGFTGFSSIRFTYKGETSLPVNTVFCVFTGYNANFPGTYIKKIEINGVDESSMFLIENVGSNTSIPLEIDPSSNKSLFLLQGQWAHGDKISYLNGKVLSGIHIGGFWSVLASPPANYSNQHPDIECLGIQGPSTPGSSWGYYQCESPYSITIFDLKKQITEFGNWESGVGDDQVNWPIGVDVCTSTCEVGECEELAWIVEPSGLTFNCYDENTVQITADWIDSNGGSTFSGGCGPFDINVDNYISSATSCSVIEYYKIEIIDAEGSLLEGTFAISIVQNAVPLFVDVPIDITLSCDETFDVTTSDIMVGCEGGSFPILRDTILVNYTGALYDIYEIRFTAISYCGISSELIQTQYHQKSSLLEVNIVGDQNVCENQTVSYSASATNASGAVEYSWTHFKASGNVTGTTANFQATMDNSNSTIELRAVDENGCEAIDVIALTITNFSVDLGAPVVETCNQNTITLTATVSPVQPGATFFWERRKVGNSNWNTLTGTTATISSSLTNDYDFRVIVTNASGCSAEDIQLVNENEIYFDLGPSTVKSCSYLPYSLVADVSPDGDAFTYQWAVNNGGNYIVQNDVDGVFEIPSGFNNQNFNFRCIVTHVTSGCTFTDFVFVERIPPSVNLGSASVDICEGESHTITASLNNASNQTDDTNTYIWEYNTGGGWLSLSESSKVLTVSPDVTTEYRMTMVLPFDSNCTASDTKIINVEQIKVKISDGAYGCPGTNHILTGSVTPSSLNVNYQWYSVSGENIVPIGTNSNTLSISPFGNQQYILEIIDLDSGCTVSDDVIVFNGDSTLPNINCQQNQTVNLDANCQFTLGYLGLASGYDDCSGVGFSQNPVGGIYNSPQTIVLSYTGTDASGNSSYCSATLQLLDTGGCFASKIDGSSFVSERQLNLSSFIKLYPNPTIDRFFLEINSNTEEEADFQLYTMSGKLVRSSKIELVEGMNVNEVDTRELVPAMYLVKLRTTNQEFIEKLIIVKN